MSRRARVAVLVGFIVVILVGPDWKDSRSGPIPDRQIAVLGPRAHPPTSNP